MQRKAALVNNMDKMLTLQMLTQDAIPDPCWLDLKSFDIHVYTYYSATHV